jgi:hypothetical protein
LKSSTHFFLAFLLLTLFGISVHIEQSNRLSRYAASVEQAEEVISYAESDAGEGVQEMDGDGPDLEQGEKPISFYHAPAASLCAIDIRWHLIALYHFPNAPSGTTFARLPVGYAHPAFFILYHSFKDDLCA